MRGLYKTLALWRWTTP